MTDDTFLEWQFHIDLSDLFLLFQNGRLTPYHLGHAVSGLIKNDKKLYEKYKDDETFTSILDQFEKISDIDDFDGTLDRLYSWGDSNKKCWVQTF
jgi:hypothetical protein